ncbi:MAG: S-layer homology domain-containing protein [Oscillospiraceae bacterium]|nr:S-layer homology domain-containing protein [Oscillospiraceae bacterium]
MKKTRIVSALLVLIFLFGAAMPALALEDSELQALIDGTAAFQLKNNPPVQGSEWAMLGLVRSGCALPQGFCESYYESVREYLEGKQGKLTRVTEYARFSIVLTAMGYDPAQVGGYDLTEGLMDFEKMTSIGMNGAIWGLLGLDCGNHRSDDPEAAAVRQRYIDHLLKRQLANGGFSLMGKGGASSPADTDITAMTLQALAGYTDLAEVKEAVDRAVDCLSALQQEDGGYGTMGNATSESTAQVLVALGEMGIDVEDPRFVKNGRSALDALLDYRQKDGSFLHVLNNENQGQSGISCDQGFYALVAVLLARKGEGGLYHMAGVPEAKAPEASPLSGLPGKHPDVQLMPVTLPGVSFHDIQASPDRAAVEALAARGIINGMGDGSFAPEEQMTRAQFAAITVKALGLTPKANGKFTDVVEDKWYAPYIGTANAYGIVNGVSDTEFNPEGTITRQDAATMVARAAEKLCGMDTKMDKDGIRFYLAQFSDYVKVSDYAQGPMAFCFREGILREDEFDENLEPKEPILRGEIARMIYRLLLKAQLIDKE